VTNRFYGRNKAKVAAILCGVVIIFGIMTGVRGRAWENDITLWSDAVNKYPEDGRVWYNLGSGYRKIGNLKEAENYFLMAAKYDPDNHLAYNNLGIIYDMNKESQKAIKYYKKSFMLNQNFLNSAYNLASLYRDIGNIDESNKFYNKAISIEPGYYQTYFDLASNYCTQKEYQKALEVLQKVLNSSPGESDRKRAQENINLINGIMKTPPGK
jgi:tetratricopeptide (TPR) repeat protein